VAAAAASAIALTRAPAPPAERAAITGASAPSFADQTNPVAPIVAPMTHVTVRVSPPNAQISIDGTPVGQSPFEATYPRTTESHNIKAVAQGFVTKTETIVFSLNDMSLSLNLERTPEAAAWPLPVTPPGRGTKPTVVPQVAIVSATPPASPMATELDPRGGKLPKREVDTHDPYGAK
jgi:PEGA domain